ncbi:hypothetical protein OS175_09910 [Marinicella sp. S1101]|uniref:hypothetical protein n=1 Tax=Marinicella marina TaxID=2996016 RepID=UPI002260A161|nr:hypothetical protein [Marinicella marina]MCX7554193.1 hypothetical protein [Marinicella marina]MDJ1141114.1 hypothetical protein [Marinicella marina]
MKIKIIIITVTVMLSPSGILAGEDKIVKNNNTQKTTISTSELSSDKQSNKTATEKLITQSLARLDDNRFNSETDLNVVSDWLVGLPTTQFSVLSSTENLGSDEYELSINLPFKSPTRKKLDEQLINVQKLYESANHLQKRLFVSGLIREIVWQYQIAHKKRAIEHQKLTWLNKQKALLSKLLSSGGAHLSLLSVESQVIQVKLMIIDLDQEVDLRLKQFQQITGVKVIPDGFHEEIFTTTNDSNLNEHPSVLQLQLALEQSSLLYELTGKANQPINVSLSAIDIKTNDFNDRQYGVAFELPLGSGKHKSQAERASWLQEQNELSVQLMNFKRIFSLELIKLKNEQSFLMSKHSLLQQQSEKTEQIFSMLERLKNTNEMNQDLYYLRMAELIGLTQQVELNEIYLKQNISRQNQLAGVPL